MSINLQGPIRPETDTILLSEESSITVKTSKSKLIINQKLVDGLTAFLLMADSGQIADNLSTGLLDLLEFKLSTDDPDFYIDEAFVGYVRGLIDFHNFLAGKNL